LATGCHPQYFASYGGSARYAVNDSIPEDLALEALIAPYRERLAATMRSGLAPLGGELRLGKPESTLGNWLTDILQRYTTETRGISSDFTLCNYGGVRIGSIGQDSLRVGTIYELLPFDNELVIVTLSGSETEALIRYMARSGFWPLSRGIEVMQSDNRIEWIKIGGKPLEVTRPYRVQMPDYVANGGDGTAFLAVAPREKVGSLMRDAVIAQLQVETQKGIVQEGKLDERVIIRNH